MKRKKTQLIEMSDTSLEFVDLHYPECFPIWYKVADSPCSGTGGGTSVQEIFKLKKIMRLVKTHTKRLQTFSFVFLKIM